MCDRIDSLPGGKKNPVYKAKQRMTLLHLLPPGFTKKMLARFGGSEGFEGEEEAAVVLIRHNWVDSLVLTVNGLVNWIACMAAIYFCFRRNDGFDLGSLVVAVCCYWCYLAYALATPKFNKK